VPRWSGYYVRRPYISWNGQNKAIGQTRSSPEANSGVAHYIEGSAIKEFYSRAVTLNGLSLVICVMRQQHPGQFGA
jgi:hypothetical protein